MPDTLSEEDEIGSSFAYMLPVRPGWEGALASITLSGPDGSVTLDGESDCPWPSCAIPAAAKSGAFCATFRPPIGPPWTRRDGPPS